MKNTLSLQNLSLDKKIQLNTVFLFIFRVASIGISFLLVPLLINYLDTKLYGVWLTILSVTSWINFFDIGIGNGLRNKLTESLTQGKIKLSKHFVSTAYILLTFVSSSFFVIFLFGSKFINWAKVFNVAFSYNAQLYPVMIVIMASTLFNFVLSLNNSVAYANQEASYPGLRQVVFNLSLLLGVLALLASSPQGSLLKLAIIYALATAGSNIVLSIYLFSKHKILIPSTEYFSLAYAKPLISLGIKFFIIQIAALIIFTTDNLIITQILGPSEVTSYNVVHKVFSIVLFIHTIIITPLWSGFTEAYTKSDFEWIKDRFRKLSIYTVLLAFLIVAIIFSFRYILLFWLKDLSFYRLPLIITMGVYTFIMIWNNNFAYFLNGISEIKLQLYTAIIGASVNIPLSIFFAKNISLGIVGVALGSIVSLSLFAIVGPLQTLHILKLNERTGYEKSIS